MPAYSQHPASRPFTSDRRDSCGRQVHFSHCRRPRQCSASRPIPPRSALWHAESGFVPRAHAAPTRGPSTHAPQKWSMNRQYGIRLPTCRGKAGNLPIAILAVSCAWAHAASVKPWFSRPISPCPRVAASSYDFLWFFIHSAESMWADTCITNTSLHSLAHRATLFSGNYWR